MHCVLPVANALAQRMKYALVGDSACVVFAQLRTLRLCRPSRPNCCTTVTASSPDLEVEPRTNHAIFSEELDARRSRLPPLPLYLKRHLIKLPK